MNDNALIEINPSILRHIDQADRTDWSYDQYIDMGIEAVQAKSYSQWIIGMLATEVAHRWNNDQQFGDAIGVNRDSLRVYRHIYKRFTEQDKTFVPPMNMPWGVLSMAAKTENPVETVQRLEDNNNMTMESAYRDIKTEETGVSPPRKPRVRLKWNDETHLYDLDIADEDLENIDWRGLRTKLVDLIVSK